MIKLRSDAKITSRCDIDGYFEMKANAIVENKNCIVYWIFENDDEKQLDDYDYNKIDRIEYIKEVNQYE